MGTYQQQRTQQRTQRENPGDNRGSFWVAYNNHFQYLGPNHTWVSGIKNAMHYVSEEEAWSGLSYKYGDVCNRVDLRAQGCSITYIDPEMIRAAIEQCQ